MVYHHYHWLQQQQQQGLSHSVLLHLHECWPIHL